MSEYIIECEYDSDEGWIPGEHREEVVRCRNCKWFLADEVYGDACRWFCRSNDNPDGFCKWGERETNNKTDDFVTHDSRTERTCKDVWDVELTGRLRFQCSECGAVSLEITPRFCPNCGKVVEWATKS